MKRWITALAAAVIVVIATTGQLGYNPAGVINIVEGTLSAAQVAILNATPIVVIAAPGSGKAIVIESLHVMLDWVSVAYDGEVGGEDLQLQYTTGTQAALQACDNITCLNVDAVADTFGYVSAGTALGVVPVDNDSVEMTINSGEIFTAAGNSPIHYRIRYRIITLDLS